MCAEKGCYCLVSVLTKQPSSRQNVLLQEDAVGITGKYVNVGAIWPRARLGGDEKGQNLKNVPPQKPWRG